MVLRANSVLLGLDFSAGSEHALEPEPTFKVEGAAVTLAYQCMLAEIDHCASRASIEVILNQFRDEIDERDLAQKLAHHSGPIDIVGRLALPVRQ